MASSGSAAGGAGGGCPWGKLPAQQAASFDDVMSEELARKFEREDFLSASLMPFSTSPRAADNNSNNNNKDKATDLADSAPTEDATCGYGNDSSSSSSGSSPVAGGLLQQETSVTAPAGSSPNTDDDLLLAQMLQEEFDRESQVEQRRRAGLNISGAELGHRKLKNGDSIGEDGSPSDDDSDADDVGGGGGNPRDVDRFAHAARTEPTIGVRGFVRTQEGVLKTKHDPDMCGRRNACKVMELTSPGIATGDGAGFDMKLNNSVYNSLRVHSKMEERRAARLHDKKEKATAEHTMDMNTRLLIYKLINRQILEEVNGCISTGKESTVFHAKGGVTEEFNVPDECAVKVFKTTLNEFKNRSEYIKEDFRFKDRMSKLNPRKTIHVWAEKELYNLHKIHRAGINCPQAVILKKHVLVMTFIGADGKPAPKLRDAHLNREQLREAWLQCCDILRKLYKECQLVHADLSEYNLLWHLGHVWVIDVSQAVDHLHPHALEFLLRDCTNLCEFFRKQGLVLPDGGPVPEPKHLFQDVCGLELPGEGAELLSQVRNFVREEDLLKRDNDHFYDQRDQFEVMFDHASPLLDVAGQGSKP